MRSNWPRCSLLTFQCLYLKSGSLILRETLVSLLIVSWQCLHMLQQSVVAATISYGNCETDKAIKTLTNALISSPLDYCNLLYCGIADGLLSRLQPVQNAAARLVTGLGRREHITSVLRQLHWLPVRQRLMFKLATLVYRLLTGTAPAYLSDECHLTSSVGVRCLHRLTPGHVYLVAHTMVSVIAVLPLPVLVCATVCRCSFENWAFCSTVLKFY